MSYLFSPATRGFYVSGMHRDVPPDVFEVSSITHAQFMDAVSQGRAVTIERNGVLVAVPPSPKDGAVAALAARRRRDSLLATCDFRVLPDAPGSRAVKKAWRVYRAALRDVPAQPGFPHAVEWPVPPAAK